MFKTSGDFDDEYDSIVYVGPSSPGCEKSGHESAIRFLEDYKHFSLESRLGRECRVSLGLSPRGAFPALRWREQVEGGTGHLSPLIDRTGHLSLLGGWDRSLVLTCGGWDRLLVATGRLGTLGPSARRQPCASRSCRSSITVLWQLLSDS